MAAQLEKAATSLITRAVSASDRTFTGSPFTATAAAAMPAIPEVTIAARVKVFRLLRAQMVRKQSPDDPLGRPARASQWCNSGRRQARRKPLGLLPGGRANASHYHWS